MHRLAFCGLVLVGMATTLGGCSTGGRELLTVRVTNGSHEPVAQARVSVAPMKFFLPMYPYPTLGGDESPDISLTDADGRVTLEAATGGPNRLQVVTRTRQRFVAIIEFIGTDEDDQPRWTMSGATDQIESDASVLHLAIEQ